MGIQAEEKRKGGGASKKGGGPGRSGKLRRGQKTKKKTDVEFKDAYSGASELAPPPIGRDITAVPAKLRRIMNLRAAVASGEKYDPNAQKQKAKNDFKAPGKKDKKRKLNGENSKENEVESKDELPAAKKSKLSRAEEEIKMLNAKLDMKAGVKPKSTGEKWKGYLNDKKKRKKGKKPNEEGLPEMHRHERIEFGDVVQAPPKLSFPKKASAIKERENAGEDQTLFRERLRLQAIESYRQRKKWAERPGQKLPTLELAVAVPEL